MIKATSAIAGAKLVTIVISILRTKVMALLLGPSGMGIVNLVASSVDLTRVLFACGLDGATVRKVAEASAEDDPALLDQTYRIAARTALFIGAAACVALAIASPILSAKILGTPAHFWWYAVAGGSLIFTPLLGVQLAFLQGLKRSKTLAICQIIASIAGAVLAIALVALMGKVGAIIALLPISVASLTIHHHFLKPFRSTVETPRDYHQWRESKKLIKLGSGFAINGIWLTASGWLNLLFIQNYYGHDLGVLQVGLYGAASTMANFYIGILISAMGTEFYPSLVQAGRDRSLVNRLLNQQTLLSIGIGIPVTLGMLVLTPWILQLLYTREFIAGGDLMRWLLVGMAIRFAACPIGFAVLAVGRPRLIAMSELMTGIVMITSSYVMLQIFGLVGLGIAFVITNSLYLAGIFVVTRRMGICWNASTGFFVIETFGVLAACLMMALLMPAMQGALTCLVLTACYMAHLVVLVRRETGISLAQLFSKLKNFTTRNHA